MCEPSPAQRLCLAGEGRGEAVVEEGGRVKGYAQARPGTWFLGALVSEGREVEVVSSLHGV